MNKLRLKILTKLSQATPAQPTVAPVVLGPVPNVPSDLISNLYKGYNPNTVQLLTSLANQLNDAMHYASNGKDNFNKIVGNNLDLSAALPDQKNVGMLAIRVYKTFLNSKNPFATATKPFDINNWADAVISSSEFNNLSKINPSSVLATKLQGNLKTNIQNLMVAIKQQNPMTA